MRPKVLIGVLFVITFVVSFVVYLIVVSFLGSHIDLSSAAKKDLEVSPNITETTFKRKPINNNISDIQQKATQSEETYQTDLQGISPVGETANSATANSNVSTTVKLDENVNYQQEQPVTQIKESKNPVNEVNTIEKPKVKPGNNATIKFMPDNQQQPQPTTDNKEVKPVSRVYVGEYNTPEDAKRASDNMMNSNPNVVPIVKQAKGKYTLQIGAFSDKTKAENLVKTLNNQKYAATVKSE